MTGRVVLILTLSLVAFCQGEPECSAANQCSDLWTAKKCDAVQQCISDVWSQQRKPSESSDDVCSICLRMVKQARDVLRDNGTREELRQVLEGSCNLLVLKPAIEICDHLMDELADELVKVLSSQMDPETVCAVAKLCNNNALITAQKDSKDCVHCKAFMGAASENMKSLSQEKFKSEVLDVCRTLGGFSDACSQFGLAHASFWYDTTKSVLKRSPCEAAQLCPFVPESQDVVSHSGSGVTKEQMCPLCKTVMKSLRKQMLRVKSAGEFEERVAGMCERLDLSNSTCSQISSRSFYEKLASFEALPELMCHVAYCREGTQEDVPVWPLVSAEPHKSVDMDVFELLAFAELLAPQLKKEEPEIRPRPTIAYGDPIENPVFLAPALPAQVNYEEECDTCMDVLGILSEPARHDDDYLNKMFDVVCDSAKNREKCKQFMDKYSSYLTRAFAEGGVSIELCTSLVPSCQVKEPDATSASNCGLCLTLMKILKNGDTAVWGSALEKECIRLHGTPSLKCQNLPSVLANLSSLLKNSTEREACYFMGQCERNPEKKEKVEASSKTSCSTCLLTLESLQDILRNNESDDAIEHALNSLCVLLPHVEKHLCYDFVRALGVDGIKKMIESLSPAQVCHDLHACDNIPESPTPLPYKVITKQPLEPETKGSCKFCLMVMEMMLNQLENNKTEEAIAQTLKGICKYFPEETRDACNDIIDQYTDTIIDMVLADFNATEICTYLKFCHPRSLSQGAGKRKIIAYDVETNEVRDWDEYDNAPERFEEESRVELLDRFHQEVQECALCEALVGIISEHEDMMKAGYDFISNSEMICSSMPRNKLRKCSTMLVSYGPSIVNLIKKYQVNRDEVCVYVDLCDSKMQAKVNQPVSLPEPEVVPGGNDCLRGPAFWCANAENAQKCGTLLHCQELVWKTWKHSPKTPSL